MPRRVWKFLAGAFSAEVIKKVDCKTDPGTNGNKNEKWSPG